MERLRKSYRGKPEMMNEDVGQADLVEVEIQ